MYRLLSVLNKIDSFLYQIQKVLMLIGVAVMVVINGAQVFCRYVLHSSLSWSEQVSVLLFFILIMLGGNLSVKTDGETKIDILKFKNEKANILLRVVTDLICVVTLVVLIASGIALLGHASKFPQYLSSIHLDYFYIYIWLLVGFFLVLFDKIINLLKSACRLKGIDISGLYGNEKERKEEAV